MKQLLLLVLALMPMGVNAEPVEIDGIYYNLSNKGGSYVAEVTSNPNFYVGDVVIPESVTYNGNDYSVYSIGDQAFYYCRDLTSIAFPDGLTNIGIDAFYYCI